MEQQNQREQKVVTDLDAPNLSLNWCSVHPIIAFALEVPRAAAPDGALPLVLSDGKSVLLLDEIILQRLSRPPNLNGGKWLSFTLRGRAAAVGLGRTRHRATPPPHYSGEVRMTEPPKQIFGRS